MRTRFALVAVLALGGAAAVAVGSERHVTASTADDISVYTAAPVTAYTSTSPQGTTTTSSTPTVATSTTPDVSTSQTPTVVTAQTIDPVHAAQVAFYKATIIKKLPPAPPIAKLPAQHWGIQVPAHCNALCVYAGTIIAYNVGVWYASATVARAKTATLGTVHVGGTGDLHPKITIARRYRRKLARSRHAIRLTVVQKVTDSTYGFTKSRRQVLTLRPR